MAFNWGEVVYKSQSTFGPRIQQTYQIVLVYRGELRVFLDGESIRLKAGQGIWLIPGITEFYEMGLNGSLHHFWIHADPGHFPSNPTLGWSPRRRIFTVQPALTRLTSSLQESSQNATDKSNGYLSSLASAACWWVLETIGASNNKQSTHHPAIEKVIGLIQQEYPRHLDLTEMAREARVSPQHLTRLFQKSLHTTPIRYLWNFRDQEATRLLRDSGLTFAEIADRCGYANPFHLTRRISKNFGKSPKALRKSFWQS